ASSPSATPSGGSAAGSTRPASSAGSRSARRSRSSATPSRWSSWTSRAAASTSARTTATARASPASATTRPPPSPASRPRAGAGPPRRLALLAREEDPRAGRSVGALAGGLRAASLVARARVDARAGLGVEPGPQSLQHVLQHRVHMTLLLSLGGAPRSAYI